MMVGRLFSERSDLWQMLVCLFWWKSDMCRFFTYSIVCYSVLEPSLIISQRRLCFG